MGTFITDRTQADIDATLTLFAKIKTSGWDSLSATEQATYLSIDQDYEDRGRFSKASAERISSYMSEITAKLLSSEDEPAKLPAVVDGRTISAWGRRNFETDPDYPNGTVKTVTIPSATNITNLITNGGFDTVTTGWISGLSTISIDTARLKILASAQFGEAHQSMTSLTIGHKYYVSTYIQGTSGANIGIEFFATRIMYSGGGSNQKISFIETATATSRNFYANDFRTSGWTAFYIDNVIIIDLTAIYGAGNEPTKAEMDALLANNFTNSWFDGTVPYPDIDTVLDTIRIPAHGFTIGQWYRLKYTTGDTTLGGLTNGNYYDVYIKDANTIAFLYGGIGTDITSKPASGTYTLEFITAPYMPISRDDFQYWVDILTVAYTADPVGWQPNTSPYLTYETLNALEYASEAILAGTLTTITEYAGRYITGDEVLAFDEYL